MENEEKDTSNMEDDDFKKAEEESPPSSETELDDEGNINGNEWEVDGLSLIHI